MITVMIEPDNWLTKARQGSRRLVVRASMSDEDIDRMIKQAQKEVEPLLGRGPFSIPTSFLSAVLKLNSLPFLVVRWSDRHRGLLKSAVTEQEILNVLTRPHIAR
jgi:hypothetical protein